MLEKPSAAGALLCVVLLGACVESRPSAAGGPGTDDSRTVQGEGGPARPGIRFDPAALDPGDSVGGLVLDSATVRRTIVDSTYVGSAWFRGEIELIGSIMAHPDEDMRESTVCFEADPASAARLPRWQGDERRPWFCFTNPADAANLTGGIDEAATIVIDEFTIHRGLSDEVNSARLVEVRDGQQASRRDEVGKPRA